MSLVDPRGETDLIFRVKHASLVELSACHDEYEYLFAPYSVFTVRKFTEAAGMFSPTFLCGL